MSYAPKRMSSHSTLISFGESAEPPNASTAAEAAAATCGSLLSCAVDAARARVAARRRTPRAMALRASMRAARLRRSLAARSFSHSSIALYDS